MNELTLPLLSVVVSTYNNADSLEITLAQLLSQELADEAMVEFVIVNNNSSDHTERVVDIYTAKTPKIISIFEKNQGLSHARNAGVNCARGQYVLFTDDDANLPPNWVQSYINILQRHQPECCYSKIAVIWHKPKPWWYCGAFRSCFVELDYGQHLLEVNDVHHEFFGKNFCIRKSEILAQGGFDAALGRVGDKLVAGEETVIYRKLIARRKRVIYFPDAEVGHRLKDKEFTLEHITKLFLDGAYTSYNVGRIFSTRQLFGRPFGVLVASIKLALISAVRWSLTFFDGRKSIRLYYKLSLFKGLNTILLWIKNP